MPGRKVKQNIRPDRNSRLGQVGNYMIMKGGNSYVQKFRRASTCFFTVLRF